MDTNLAKQLQELGLAEKESRVYLAGLELGSSSAQEISRKAGVNRPTTYVQIDFLTKKGLMSSVIRGKKRYFNAEPPEQLARLLDKQKKEIQDKKDEFEKYLPELKTLYNLSEEKPKVRFFEGIEGLKAIQRDILATDIKVFKEVANVDKSSHAYQKGMEHYGNKIIEKLEKIPVFVIYTSDKGDFKPSQEDNRKRLYVPKEKFDFPSDIVIYGENKVGFLNPIKINGVIIENEEIYRSLNNLFDLVREKNTPRQ